MARVVQCTYKFQLVLHMPRDLESFQKLITELGAKHDELADMKSNYDCEEPVDGATLACMNPAA